MAASYYIVWAHGSNGPYPTHERAREAAKKKVAYLRTHGEAPVVRVYRREPGARKMQRVS